MNLSCLPAPALPLCPQERAFGICHLLFTYLFSFIPFTSLHTFRSSQTEPSLFPNPHFQLTFDAFRCPLPRIPLLVDLNFPHTLFAFCVCWSWELSQGLCTELCSQPLWDSLTKLLSYSGQAQTCSNLQFPCLSLLDCCRYRCLPLLLALASLKEIQALLFKNPFDE